MIGAGGLSWVVSDAIHSTIERGTIKIGCRPTLDAWRRPRDPWSPGFLHRKDRQMALDRPFTIRIEKPETALAETMNEMRTWLDKHKVQPVDFKIAMTGMPGIAFDIQF